MRCLDYVNIKQGTKSVPRFSNGNTLPMTQMPFGMGGFVPQTTSDRGNWFFYPEDRSLEGVRLTHQPSPWVGDYGCITFMPQEGEVYSNVNNRWSGYRPEEAVVRPDYLKLDFLRYNAVLELAPTERGAAIKIDYQGNLTPRFAIMPVYGECGFELDTQNKRVTGYTNAQRGNTAVEFKMYFVFEFSCGIDSDETYITKDSGEFVKGTVTSGIGTGINVALKGKNVEIKMASSYISAEQALENLNSELVKLSFQQAKDNAMNEWEKWLGKVEIETHNEEQMKTFYTCLARMFLYPHINYEIDKNGDEIHYCPHNGKIANGKTYTNNGLWDTFRTVYPFLSVVAPEKYAEILEGFINIYKDCGWLPKWPAIGELGYMPGTFIDAVIADAAVKGIIKGELLETAFEGMLKHSKISPEDGRYGRIGVTEYNQYGYVPRHLRECVNNSLDSYYGDYCIAQVAKILGENDLYSEYMDRSQNYKVLFDKETGFMRGKDIDGVMKENFNPLDWGDEYTEGSAYQTSFAVHHDFEGLTVLYGGKENFLKKIDEVFATPPKYNAGGYHGEIHEMTEMAAVDFGQCAISNQPSFHIPYLYAFLGEQDKTNYWVEKIANELFSYKDDGFPGDEDNGTMAGWYVFSCLGFYPLCPGKAEYVKGKMLVKSAKINGRDFDIDKFHGNMISHDNLLKL
jgi:predicted alpha-1,2-mannosidase